MAPADTPLTYLGTPVRVIGRDPDAPGNVVVKFLEGDGYLPGELVSLPAELLRTQGGDQLWTGRDRRATDRRIGDRRILERRKA